MTEDNLHINILKFHILMNYLTVAKLIEQRFVLIPSQNSEGSAADTDACDKW